MATNELSDIQKRRRNFLTTHKENAIVKSLSEIGHFEAACSEHGISPKTMRLHMAKNPELKERVENARDMACVNILKEIKRRGQDGYDEPIFYQGRIVGYKRVYSDTLLQRQAEAMMPELFSRKTRVDVTHHDDSSSALKAKLESFLEDSVIEGEVIEDD